MKQIKYLLALVLLSSSLAGCLKENKNPSEGTPSPMAALVVVKDLDRGSEVKLSPETLAGAHLTTGVVISDASTQNLPEGYVIIQNSWRNVIRGIAIVLDANTAQSYSVGDSIVIDLTGATLKREKGTLTLQNIQKDKIELISSGNKVIVQSVSLANLSASFGKFESTMISTTADLATYPTSGETLEGDKKISDGGAESEPSVLLNTQASATFSKEKVAPSATFRGIAFNDNDKKQIRMRTIADMMFPSGSIYPGFPETFEEPDQSFKNNYLKPEIDNNVDMLTGNWKLYASILGNTANRDRIVSGAQAIRFNQNLKYPALLQMNFDVADGASKVTFWYGAYWTDASSTFILEYSSDQGETWSQLGKPISDAHKTSQSLNAKQATFMMNVSGPVRFRINKLGLGATSGTSVENGRLGVDDFAIYKNY